MNFEEAYLTELSKEAYSKAWAYYDEQKAESSLKTLLKYKYGKVSKEMTPEQIFQLEGSGSKVLSVKHKKTGLKFFAVIKHDNNFDDIKKQIKQLGFKIKRAA